MILHKDTSAFNYTLQLATKETGLRLHLLEKDYWVTLALKRLSESPYKDDVVFKGGTSLSKCYKIIDRFSEDVDLAINNKMPAGVTKKLLKNVEAAISVDLVARPDNSGKSGLKRTTIHDYAKMVEDDGGRDVSEGVKLEITAYSQTHPCKYMPVESYIAHALRQKGRDDLVLQFQMQPFEVKTLGLERTFTEKVMALIKYSSSQDSTVRLRDKIRHIYDLHQILTKSDEMIFFLQSDYFFDILRSVTADDRTNKTSNLEWLDRPFGSCQLFGNTEETWASLESVYFSKLEKIVIGELPPPAEIIAAIKLIGERLNVYDCQFRGNISTIINDNFPKALRGPKM